MMVFLCFFNIYYKKIFKIPKEESEAINQRTDNTHPREKKDKQWSSKYYTEMKDWTIWTTQIKRTGINLGAPEEWVVPVPLLAPIMLLLLQT